MSVHPAILKVLLGFLFEVAQGCFWIEVKKRFLKHLSLVCLVFYSLLIVKPLTGRGIFDGLLEGAERLL